MKMYLRCVAALSLLVSAVSSAQLAPDNQALETKFVGLLGMQVSSIANAPVPGLLEVMTDRGLFYASEDGKYLVHGRIYNMDEGMRNETENALTGVRKDGIAGFSNDMIEFKAKNEQHVVSIFTDITCGYCRKLHNEIADYNELGITVRYLAFPRGGLGSSSHDDLVSIWCAENKQEAMTNAKAGGAVEKRTCETQVDKQYLFGQQIGVSGTPAIVLEDGTMIPGYQPAATLKATLDTAS
ncbi:MAG: bifunctional protein-disulfide isomerase/oxidoreductase DsbC [Alteromonadaceae bacterium]|nr:bifunctional protein-disulfide isomerase/oxidoreductase DsbC [Alteromonadaceae bacterium]